MTIEGKAMILKTKSQSTLTFLNIPRQIIRRWRFVAMASVLILSVAACDVSSGKLAEQPKIDTVTAQMFGAAADGVTDDTRAVQAAINWAIQNKARVRLHGPLVITDTIKISNSVRVERVTIEMDSVSAALGTAGSSLIWQGDNDTPMVECGIMQRSRVRLNLKNGNKATGVTGFYWHNPNDKRTSSNGNEVSLSVVGCELGLQWGDFTNDGYDSNIDDNLFPFLVFSDCFHHLLIDSARQDNNVIQKYHGGGLPSVNTRIRDYVIRSKRCGNGFKIENGFMRSDWMRPDSAVIDIPSGSFSCDYLSIEGRDDGSDDHLALKLGTPVSREQSHINKLVTVSKMRDSNGDCVIFDGKSGAAFTNCSLGGNLKTTRPITATGMVFTDGYGVVLEGARASAAGWTTGTRKSNGFAITPHSVVKATGFAGRLHEVDSEIVWAEISNYSIFRKRLNSDSAVSDPSQAVKHRDIGREVTFIFEADGTDRKVEWPAAFELADGSAETTVPANLKRVYKFIYDGTGWVEVSRSGT